MARKFSEWLSHRTTGWVALAALVLFALFTALVLPRQASQAEATSAGAGSPDTSFFYTPSELYRLAGAYGAEGRAAYVRARATFDVVWPIVYTLFLVTAIGWAYGRAFTPHSPWQRANLIPFAGIGFDYLENVATSVVMVRYPGHAPVAAALAPFFTLLKWVFLGGSFILLAGGLLVAALRWLGGKRVR